MMQPWAGPRPSCGWRLLPARPWSAGPAARPRPVPELPHSVAPQIRRRMRRGAAQVWRQATLRVVSPRPQRTEEGVAYYQASPETVLDAQDEGRFLTGAIVWCGALALAKFFAWREAHGRPDERVAGKAVLELGAGTGVVGLTLRKLGAASVTLTDRDPEILSLLEMNVSENGFDDRCTAVRQLDFADSSTYLGAAGFDLVVASEVLYEGSGADLAQTLGCHAPTGDVKILFCYRRPEGDETPLEGFFDATKELGFAVERLQDEDGLVVAGWQGSAADTYGGSFFVPLEVGREAHLIRLADSEGAFSSGNVRGELGTGAVQILRLTRKSQP